MGTDDFDDLSRPSGARGAADLAAELSGALDEPPGDVSVQPEDDEMGWILREDVRISRVNLRALGAADADRRARFVQALADLVSRFDEQRPTIEALKVGRRYAVDYKNVMLRRTFRVTGDLLEVSDWRPADGPTGGGWTITLESHPRFGRPSRLRIETDVMTRIAPT